MDLSLFSHGQVFALAARVAQNVSQEEGQVEAPSQDVIRRGGTHRLVIYL